MNCEQARQLFDVYLDGELPSGLATELGAHRVQCARCRQELALMEVTSHIVASDEERASLSPEFSDRLIACLGEQTSGRLYRFRRVLYIAGPFAAAAAVLVLSFSVFFDRDQRVAGEKVEIGPASVATAESPSDASTDRAAPTPRGDRTVTDDPEAIAARQRREAAEDAIDRWVRQTAQRGSALSQALDLTVMQLLDMLEAFEQSQEHESHFPGAGAVTPLGQDQTDQLGDDDIEDL